MHKIISVSGIIIIIFVIALCLPLTVPRLLGFDSYSIVSGSMEPAIPTGSLIYSKYGDPAAVEAGDVIAFSNAGMASELTGNADVIAHRVVKNDSGEKQYITQGDANDRVDMEPVPYEKLIGTVTLHIPLLGYAGAMFATLNGKLGMACAVIAGLLLNVLGHLLKPEEA